MMPRGRTVRVPDRQLTQDKVDRCIGGTDFYASMSTAAADTSSPHSRRKTDPLMVL